MHIDVEQACILLRQGQAVALPTETVYGLAALFQNEQAIEQVFSIKGRPRNNPLIVHLSSFDELQAYIDYPLEKIKPLTDAFWPGPLTLVLPVKSTVIPSIVTAGLSTAAFRVPRHPLTLEILKHVGPLVMPSANLSGKPSATQAAHVEQDFGRDFPVVDGGPCHQGVESTILMPTPTGWTILRQGAISLESLAFVLEDTPELDNRTEDKQPLCPGRLFRHYAPHAQLFLEKTRLPDAEAIVGFSDRAYPEGYAFFPLGNSSSPEEAAQNLYGCLRSLDNAGIKAAWIDLDVPKIGLWATIAERITRAADRS